MTDNFQQATPNEKSDTQKFWLALIRDVFEIIKPEDYIDFEKRVEIEHTKYIDAYIPSTGIIIEQKSPGKSLADAFSQAKNYHDWLPLSQRGRYILTCDFNEIHIHDMEEPTKPPQIINVKDATKDNLSFLLTPGETLPREITISVKAGELARALYEPLLERLNNTAKEMNYNEEKYKQARDDINIFCVRVVFLLYAEDAGLLPQKSQFHDYLNERKSMAHDALEKLFEVLSTEKDKRDNYSLEESLREFPYVNGGLFKDKVRFPTLDTDTVNIIIHDMAEGFNWAGINPTIFGAIFEAILNDETRKQAGMHYTSPANIHRVIDPLFLDGLNETLNEILNELPSFERTQKLLALQDKLAALRFLDPACGSGNFLTESFISLRRIENKILAALPENETRAVKVKITQFHGIEANPFAVKIAMTALWISDHQMWKETQEIIRSNESPLPLREYHHIKEGSAMDTLENLGWKLPGWKIEHDDMLYIMGNPPFLGYSQQDDGQKDDVRLFYGKAKSDYVSCWFWRASEYLQEENTRAAFVATNSITQGEQVAYVFKALSKRWHIKIDFAYLPFVWKNELPDPKKMAHVHVVIIGFSTTPPAKRKLYSEYKENDEIKTRYVEVDNINFYLHDDPDEDIATPRKFPICAHVPAMTLGNLPRDGGHLIIEAENYGEFIMKEPSAEKFIRRYVGAYEFINNTPRYCLWLVGATPQEIHDMPLVHERVKAVKSFRQASKREATRNLANTSWLFAEIRHTGKNYIIVPRVSSENRKYIPMGFMSPDVIASDAVSIIPDATLYHFGVLTSRVHMAWVRRVCGRLEMRYRYSGELVYNTFPWPEITEASGKGAGGRGKSTDYHARITETAQMILDARALYPDTSFAAMYDDSLMPQELRHAHEANDRAVCRAYGWSENISEDEIIAGLFGLYHELTRK